jgi:peptide/nickel transport system substrate-binding protein
MKTKRMTAKGMTVLVGVLVLTMIFFASHGSVLAAPPTGEVKTVAQAFGNGVPIPYLDSTFANDWIQLLYDNLVGFTPEGKFSPDIGLANKWEMSPDGLAWTFHLRKGVKFHDGVEVTAKDVKFSLELIIRPDSISPNASAIRGSVQGIEVKDPYTVVVRCKKPDIFLPSLLGNTGTDGMVVPKDYYEKVGRDEFAKHPVGSGPYKWHSQMVGSSIKLEATDRHWRDGVPRFKYMTYLVIPEESTQFAMLKTGEADIARISRDKLKEASNSALNVIMKEDAATVIFHINMQWTSPVFSDVRFRKALNLGIDKDAIIKNIFAGVAKPIATWPGENIFLVGGDRTLKPYPYDPQEARRLIKEGGWEGYEFTVVSYPRGGCPEYPTVVEAVAGYWEKIGLKPKIRMSEWNVWRVAWRERKTQNTVHGVDSFSVTEIGLLLQKFGEKFDFKGEAQSTVNIPEFNEKFDRIKKSLDVAEISKLMAEMYRYSYDQHLIVPICSIPDVIATTKRIFKWNVGQHQNDRSYCELIRQR